MDSLRQFEEFVGGWWTGVRFHKRTIPDGKVADRPMRFCEAIAESRKGPIIITESLASCPGSRRSFGWLDDEAIVKSIAQKTDMTSKYAKNIVSATPHLDGTFTAIEVGTHNNPDVVISFEQPESAMKLINLWQRFHGEDLMADISTFMSVCGSVAVRAYYTGEICLSFGCSESRSYGKISRDRLVVGVPFSQVKELVHSMNNQRTRHASLVRGGVQPEAWM